ncbi:TolC family protein [Pirellulaceae bacterium SH467]
MLAKPISNSEWFRRSLLIGLLIPTIGCATAGKPGPSMKFPSFAPWSKSVDIQSEPAPQARVAEATPAAAVRDPSAVQPASFEALAIAKEVTLDTPSTTTLRLEELEDLAIQNSPTLRQLEWSACKAAGYRQQVSLRPNPNLGYSAQQLADQGTDQHTLFLEREIVTGDKLQWSRRVVNARVRGQLSEVESQRSRILADVRTAYFQLLAARTKEAALSEFTEASRKALELTELRKQAKEGSQIDVLQASTQWNQIRMQQEQARAWANGYAAELAALVGIPQINPSEVSGQLAAPIDSIDWDSMLAQLRETNPEFQVATANLERASANLRRQNVQATPNLTFQIGAGVDNGTESGMINTQLSAPLNTHNRNQGNIAAAQADYNIAQLEVERIDRALRARVGRLSGNYESAKAALIRYREQLLPDIQQSLDLANQAYVAGETDFLEVLIIRRTYFELRLQAIDAERDLLLAQTSLENFGLTGAFDPIQDNSGDASLRDQAFSQQ